MSKDKKIRVGIPTPCRRCRRIDLASTIITFTCKSQSKTVHAYCGYRYRYRTRTLLAFSVKRFVVRLVVWSRDQWFVFLRDRNKPWPRDLGRNFCGLSPLASFISFFKPPFCIPLHAHGKQGKGQLLARLARRLFHSLSLARFA